MLLIESVSVNYGALRALRSVSLSVQLGQLTAITGANGAGKTTLMNAVMGTVPISSGRILFMGNDITHKKTIERVKNGLALCPEGRQVFERMTVYENLHMGGYTLPKREASRRCEEVLEAFPLLRQRIGQQAGTLSGGEQQWLAIARALMQKPKLLMLDEPTLGLHQDAARELMEMLGNITLTGTGLLVVEQDAAGVMNADATYELAGGECRPLERVENSK